MKKLPETDASPADRVNDIPRILAALRQAVREALTRHEKLGNPVAVWRDGHVARIPPEEIPDYDDMTDDVDK